MNRWQLLGAIVCAAFAMWIVASWTVEQLNKKLNRIINLLEHPPAAPVAEEVKSRLQRIERHLAKLTRDIPDEPTWFSRTFGDQVKKP